VSDIEDVIYELGYRPEDDSWDTDGRRTYVHDDDVTKDHLSLVNNTIAPLEWRRCTFQLFAFHHPSGELIELEPGGADCTGHFLHHMKADVDEQA